MLDRATALHIARLAAALTKQQRKVAELYLADPLRDLAEIYDGANCRGGKKLRPSMKREVVRRYLASTRIAAYLAALADAADEDQIVARVQPLVMQAEEVKERLSRLARMSLAELMEFDSAGVWTGEFRITRDNADVLKELGVEETMRDGQVVFRRVKPKVEDRQRALEALVRIHGLVKQPEEQRQDALAAAVWAKVFARFPQVAEAYHYELLQAAPDQTIDVTPVPSGATTAVSGGNGHG